MATRGVAEAQPPERDDRIGLLMTLIHTADSSLEGKRDLGDSAACGGITAGSVGGDPGDSKTGTWLQARVVRTKTVRKAIPDCPGECVQGEREI